MQAVFVHHSKFGAPMSLWVNRVRWIRHRRSRHVRFAPKADKRADASLSPLCANSDLMRRSKSIAIRFVILRWSGTSLHSRACPSTLLHALLVGFAEANQT